MLPPGWSRLETRPVSTGSAPKPKTIGIVVVAAFAARTAGVLYDATRTATPLSHQVAGQVRKPIECVARPAGFDCEVATFEVAGLSEPLAKCHLPAYEAFGRASIKIAHQRYGRQMLLSIGPDRAGDRGSQPRDELPSPHWSSLLAASSGAYPGRGCMGTGHSDAASRRLGRLRQPHSGRTSAPMVPHRVQTAIGSHLNRMILRALRISKLVGPDYGFETEMSGLLQERDIMQKVIELNFEETEAVVGGLSAGPRSEASSGGSGGAGGILFGNGGTGGTGFVVFSNVPRSPAAGCDSGDIDARWRTVVATGVLRSVEEPS